MTCPTVSPLFPRPQPPPPPPSLVREIRGPLVVWVIAGGVATIAGSIVWAGSQFVSLRDSVRESLGEVGLLKHRVTAVERWKERKEVVDKAQDEDIIRLQIKLK